MGPHWENKTSWNCAVCEIGDGTSLENRRICPVCKAEPIQPETHLKNGYMIVKARCKKCQLMIQQKRDDMYSNLEARAKTVPLTLQKTEKGPYVVVCIANCQVCKTKYRSHF